MKTARRTRFSDIRYADLLTFIAVQRSGSITAASLSLRVTPSQVSKAIVRLESQLGGRLFKRTTRGMILTEAGARILPHLEEIASRLQRIQNASERNQHDVTIASPSYLGSLVAAIVDEDSTRRVRGLVLSNQRIHAFSNENIFDVAITMGNPEFSKRWVSTQLGEVRLGLLGTPAVAKSLGRQPIDPQRLADVTFVGAVDGVSGQLALVNDGCPLGLERRFGHCAVSLSMGLDFAARSNQVIYGVILTAREYLERGELTEIRVRGWSKSAPVYLTVNAERVFVREQNLLIKQVKRELERHGEVVVT